MARDHLDNQGGTGFTVDNGTGLEVRTKLNKVIGALKSLQSGSGDPTTGLGQYQLHVNEISATSQILKIRNKANTDFVEIGDVAQTNLGLLSKAGGAMTGVFQLTAGSQAAPSLNFGDASTGFYKSGLNIIGITTNGDKKVVIQPTSTEFFGSATEGGVIRLRESNNNNASQYVQLKAPASISDNVTLTLPDSTGTNGQTLVTDGNGVLSFATPTVTLPTEIAFFGIQDTDQSIPSSSTAFTKLTNFSTDAVNLNTGTSWNATTGRFTVASGQAGTYKIIGVGRLTGQRRQKTMRIGISKNGNNPSFHMEEITRHNNSETARFKVQTTVIQMMTLAVGDYVELMMYNGETSAQDTEKEGTYFSGYRISE